MQGTTFVRRECRIGVAGWAIRREHADLFVGEGTHLQRYASRFMAVEINSSFYNAHRFETYQRWAESVPADFRFAVKMPKWLTHERCLEDTGDDLKMFLREVSGLGARLGPLLVQLPPSLSYDPRTTETFCSALRARHRGAIVWEPRHPTWFTGAADRRLAAHGISRVAADPSCGAEADEPAGSDRIAYFRLHGSPVMYYSGYTNEYLSALAARLRVRSAMAPVWCIFDNTARGHATLNALELEQLASG